MEKTNKKCFAQSCIFSSNTPFIRRKLESFGYAADSSAIEDINYDCKYIFTRADVCKYGVSDNYDIVDNDMIEPQNLIQFLVIVGVRLDTNYHQWFLDGSGNWSYNNVPDKYSEMIDSSWHKATIEEIKNKFNFQTNN